jgi:hypothetical protein
MPHRVRDTVTKRMTAWTEVQAVMTLQPYSERLRGNRLLRGRNFRDRLQDLRSDGVGVAL